jgi:ankyrin repeat protein
MIHLLLVIYFFISRRSTRYHTCIEEKKMMISLILLLLLAGASRSATTTNFDALVSLCRERIASAGVHCMQSADDLGILYFEQHDHAVVNLSSAHEALLFGGDADDDQIAQHLQRNDHHLSAIDSNGFTACHYSILLARGSHHLSSMSECHDIGYFVPKRSVSVYPLHLAALMGDVASLNVLLQVESAPGYLSLLNLLHVAIRCGRHNGVVESLLDRLPDDDVSRGVDHRRLAPLHSAVDARQLGAADAVLRRAGAGIVDQRLDDGSTPLHVAAAADDADMVELLLGCGADARRQRADDLRTPLLVAAAAGSTRVVGAILAQGDAGCQDVDRSGAGALHLSAQHGHLATMQTLLRQCSADTLLAVVDRNLGSPLHCAVWSGRIDIARALLDRNASVDALNGDGESSLDAAARLGDASIVVELRKRVASPETRERALQLAVTLGPLDVVKALLGDDRFECTSLLIAARRAGRRAIVDHLLANRSCDEEEDVEEVEEEEEEEEDVEEWKILVPSMDDETRLFVQIFACTFIVGVIVIVIVLLRSISKNEKNKKVKKD